MSHNENTFRQGNLTGKIVVSDDRMSLLAGICLSFYMRNAQQRKSRDTQGARVSFESVGSTATRDLQHRFDHTGDFKKRF